MFYSVPHRKNERNRPENDRNSLIRMRRAHHCVTRRGHPSPLHRDWPQSLQLTMARGKPLSDDLRTVILNMSRHLDVPAIRHYTGCPIRTIRTLLSDYRRKGTVLRKELLKQTLRGKKRTLTSVGNARERGDRAA